MVGLLTTASDLAPHFLSDCRLMLRLARRNGLRLSLELVQDIAMGFACSGAGLGDACWRPIRYLASGMNARDFDLGFGN